MGDSSTPFTITVTDNSPTGIQTVTYTVITGTASVLDAANEAGAQVAQAVTKAAAQSNNNQSGTGGTNDTSSTSASNAQSPTIGETVTFTIKATGVLGPSFALTRVSGGGSTLFSATRTDNNYVNIILTPATYCWTTLQVTGAANKTSCPSPTLPADRERAFKHAPRNAALFSRPAAEGVNTGTSQAVGSLPSADELQNAINRIDLTNSNLLIAHVFSP